MAYALSVVSARGRRVLQVLRTCRHPVQSDGASQITALFVMAVVGVLTVCLVVARIDGNMCQRSSSGQKGSDFGEKRSSVPVELSRVIRNPAR